MTILMKCIGGTRDGETHPLPTDAITELKSQIENETMIVSLCRPLPGGHVHREHYEIDPAEYREHDRTVTGCNVNVFLTGGFCTDRGSQAFRIFGGPMNGEIGLVLPTEWDLIRSKFTKTDLRKFYEVVILPGDEMAICCTTKEITPEHAELCRWFFHIGIESFVLMADVDRPPYPWRDEMHVDEMF